MNIDLQYFPGWVRKSISFSIDDGNVPMDTKFLSIVNPGGLRGTFNLCGNRLTESPEFYRALYEGHGVSNHCNYHLYPLTDGVEYTVASEPFDPATADTAKLYRHESLPGVYHMANRLGLWKLAAETETYLMHVDAGRADVEAIFGKGSVCGYTWPYGPQKNAVIAAYVRENYEYVRAGRDTERPLRFRMPCDRGALQMNATDGTLCERGAAYEAMEDDGELKFFCIGVHSVDYERSNTWGDLEEFVRRYGNRPDTFWYATIEDILHQEDAIRAARITDGTLENCSDRSLYAVIDGEKRVIAPRERISL